jgi:hypothetical protein
MSAGQTVQCGVTRERAGERGDGVHREQSAEQRAECWAGRGARGQLGGRWEAPLQVSKPGDLGSGSALSSERAQV